MGLQLCAVAALRHMLNTRIILKLKDNRGDPKIFFFFQLFGIYIDLNNNFKRVSDISVSPPQ